MSVRTFILREIALCEASDLPEAQKKACIDKLSTWL